MTDLTRRWNALKKTLNNRKATGIIVSIGAMITFAWQFQPWLMQKENDPAIYGRWLSEYEYPNGTAVVSLRGVTEYLENDAYRYSGFMTVTVAEPKGKVVYRIDGAGEWDGNSKRILIKLNGRSGSLQSFEAGGFSMSGIRYKQLVGEPEKITDRMPQGMPERFDVLSLKPNRMKLQVSDLDGNPITFDMIRTQKRIP